MQVLRRLGRLSHPKHPRKLRLWLLHRSELHAERARCAPEFTDQMADDVSFDNADG